MERKAIYPGSFDPPTNGHEHVIDAAARIFDKLRVVVAVNSDKVGRGWRGLDEQRRVSVLQASVKDLGHENVEVVASRGRFVAEEAQDDGFGYIVRGPSDMEAEAAIYAINERVSSLQPVLIPAPKRLQEVSSSMVRGIVGLRGWQGIVRDMVPAASLGALEERRAGELARDANNFSSRVITNLIERYKEPHRHYHGVGHLVFCLEWLQQLCMAGRVKYHDIQLIHEALWFHDAVYDPTKSGNEADSASLAAKMMGVMGDRLRDRIMATARHFDDSFQPTDFATQLVMDIDLAHFAEDHQYALQLAVRAEYRHVPNDVYRKKRAELLQKLLDRPRVYRTDAMHELLEAKARGNIALEIRSLERGLCD